MDSYFKFIKVNIFQFYFNEKILYKNHMQFIIINFSFNPIIFLFSLIYYQFNLKGLHNNQSDFYCVLRLKVHTQQNLSL